MLILKMTEEVNSVEGGDQKGGGREDDTEMTLCVCKV